MKIDKQKAEEIKNAFLKASQDKKRIQKCIQSGGKLSDLKDIKFYKPRL